MEEEKSVVEQTKEEFQELIKTINNIKKAAYEIDEIELSNIAITCNNKLVEIMQLFKKKNVKLEHSELGLVILFYLKKRNNLLYYYLIHLIRLLFDYYYPYHFLFV